MTTLTRLFCWLFRAAPAARRAALDAERSLYDAEFRRDRPGWPALQPPSDEIEGSGRLVFAHVLEEADPSDYDLGPYERCPRCLGLFEPGQRHYNAKMELCLSQHTCHRSLPCEACEDAAKEREASKVEAPLDRWSDPNVQCRNCGHEHRHHQVVDDEDDDERTNVECSVLVRGMRCDCTGFHPTEAEQSRNDATNDKKTIEAA